MALNVGCSVPGLSPAEDICCMLFPISFPKCHISPVDSLIKTLNLLSYVMKEISAAERNVLIRSDRSDKKLACLTPLFSVTKSLAADNGSQHTNVIRRDV